MFIGYFNRGQRAGWVHYRNKRPMYEDFPLDCNESVFMIPQEGWDCD